ncbi:antitoxin [Jiella marina]|uniref:antitoxin n=1 Tax=Jiella sp. LLJ827 TaxID=2917712 RepID=UPI002100FC95|nr:type II toxin-antitoxin system VapB family antitoxin [Jiella sp. LLJ827]MCQ0988891.1 type II toxin-antitoxin system VapB family antitoxin [Jiella sp. LLJ827]
MTRYAKVFRSGNSQAVRLPKDFRFETSQVEITRDGDAVVLRPADRKRDPWAGVKAAIALGTDDEDFFPQGREQPSEPDVRDWNDLSR